MGNVLKSKLHCEGKTYDGEAMLETSEIVFRGEKRLIIPLAEVESVTARDGRLCVTHRGGEAELELGAQAAKWAEKIRNPKSVVQKLGIKPGQHVSLANFDDDGFAADLEKPVRRCTLGGCGGTAT